MEEQLAKLIDQIRGSWRFRRVALLAAWVVCLVGWAVVLALPDRYQAGARVFVDLRTPLSGYLKDLTIQPDLTAQLALVRQSLLSRPQLERVIRETKLRDRAASPEDSLAVVLMLRERIQVGARETGAGGAIFSLSYQDEDREAGLEVVDFLVNTFIEETLGGKRAGSEVAQKFLREQIEEYEQRLRQAEERLAEFKRRNVGLMPGAQGDYFSRLQSETAQLEKLQAELAVALRGREELERQLRGEAVSAASQTALDSTAIQGSTTARIREAQSRLDSLLLTYTEKHPDVIALRETIASLEERRAAELDELRRGSAAALSGHVAANPVIQSIQLALNKADVEIAGLRARIADGQRRVADLQKLVDTAPEVEAEFARLNRDYDATRQRHLELLDRAERAKLGDQAEETGAVRFEIVEPPAATFQPVAPNRPLLLVGVLFVGLGVGAALAFVLHQLRPVFTSARTLHEITGLPVLGVVSKTWLDRQRLQRRRELFRYSAAAAGLVAALGFLLKFSDAGVRMANALFG